MVLRVVEVTLGEKNLSVAFVVEDGEIEGGVGGLIDLGFDEGMTNGGVGGTMLVDSAKGVGG